MLFCHCKTGIERLKSKTIIISMAEAHKSSEGLLLYMVCLLPPPRCTEIINNGQNFSRR